MILVRKCIIDLSRICYVNQCATSIISNVRYMSVVKKRFTVHPFWQPKPTRILYPENLSPENIEFVQERIEDQYMSPLNHEDFVPEPYVYGSYRCGLVARKLGSTYFWTKTGRKVASTLLHIPDNHVIKYIPPEELSVNDRKYERRVTKKKRPLGALVVGAESCEPTKFTKEYFNLFYEAGVMPKRRLTKFYITPNARLPPGTPLSASHFKAGQLVDCQGITIDHGFQGVIKRWGFKGGRATHGTTRSHRRPGNIGATGEASRVMPGTKLPGHMGRLRRVHRGTTVLRINTKHNIIWVKGRSIPGEVGNYVVIFDSILYKNTRKPEDFPEYFPTFNYDGSKEVPENMYEENIHDLSQPSIVFEEEKTKKKKK